MSHIAIVRGIKVNPGDVARACRTLGLRLKRGPNRVAEVNRALKVRGELPRLRAGRGYYYFDGPALAWPSSSVYVYRAIDLSVDRWLEEYDLLKGRAE